MSKKTFANSDSVMAFGKYCGLTLNEISDKDGGYVLWMHESKILQIEKSFLEAVEMSEREKESEMRDIINEHFHDIY